METVFDFFNINDENKPIFYDFLNTWIGLQNIVSWGRKEYYCNYPSSPNEKKCNSIKNMSDCKEDIGCKDFKNICQPIEYIKRFIENNYIKNTLNNKIYSIISIQTSQGYRGSYPVFLVSEEDKNGVFIFNFGTIDTDYTDDWFIELSINYFIDEIQKFKDEYKLKNILLCGHSYGGYIVQNIALHLESLDGIFLITSGVYPWFNEDDTENYEKFVKKTNGKLLNFGTKKNNFIDGFLIKTKKRFINMLLLNDNDTDINPEIFFEINFEEIKPDDSLHEWYIYKQYLLMFLGIKLDSETDTLKVFNLNELKVYKNLDNVTTLIVEKSNESINKYVLPKNLIKLDLGFYYEREIDTSNLPKNLKELIVNGKNIL